MSDNEVDDKSQRTPYIELSIADTNVQTGTVAVTWCVSPELLKSLAERGIKDPQVVIITATADDNKYHVTKEYRVVAPLKDLMAYVEFRSAGPCRVWGFVSEKNSKEAKSRYLSRDDGKYKTDILNSDGSEYRYDWLNYETKQRDNNVADPLNVIVPQEVFAPEPSKFEKAWVNWLFKQKCVDQCAFRRRRMFAYSLQIFPFLGSMFCRVVMTLLALLFGMRAFSFEYILHPLSSDLPDSTDMFDDGSIFIRRLSEDEEYKKMTPGKFARKFWSLPFMPVLFMVWTGILYLALKSMMPVWYIGLFVVCIVGFLYGGWKAINYLDAYLTKRQKELDALPPWYLDKEEMDLIICSSNKMRKSLKDLPAHKRTLRLRFQDLKSRVCRPFST